MKKERIIELKDKTIATWKEEGTSALIKRTKLYFNERKMRKKMQTNPKLSLHEAKDILFINGCTLPHPQRYRVDHQIEQLLAVGLSCSKVDYDKITLDLVKYFRAFVIYRCPITPDIEKFINKAKENNKVTFYDIDDLVFDLDRTKEIKAVQEMSKKDRELYDDGVVRMQKTLNLCDYGIASTTRLQTEMSKYLTDVYVNRNVASEAMISFSEKALALPKDNEKIMIGYFSGTITHNDDFKLVMSPLVKLLKEYDNVYLKIVGLLDLPEEMESVKDKIISSPFVDWKNLPELIHSVDINIVPLEDSIFNEAKSENKWTEASLVKVATVASNVGALKDVIEDKKTGLLSTSEEDWYNNLKELIENKEYRKTLAENAYNEVHKNHTTLSKAYALKEFIESKLNKNIYFVLPSVNVSGGILVAMKHAYILKKQGYDVALINAQDVDEEIVTKDGTLNVIAASKTEFTQKIDTLVATMWLTLDYVKKYPYVKKRKYLVQGYEVDFYKRSQEERIKANSTYLDDDISYITISKWCEKWLKEKYKRTVKYAPNGIDLDLFKVRKRKNNEKIKILIEGNCNDFYKNVDESFKIVEKLDKSLFEIHYLSYEKEPKKWYYVDKFYHKVPHEEVANIYGECDILIKTSLLDSFAYPPLEMMATGGVCLVLPNDGNIEYLKDEENCLFYEQGNIDDAVEKIMRMKNDKKLRDKLIENGIKTAKSRSWENIKKEVLTLYEK